MTRTRSSQTAAGPASSSDATTTPDPAAAADVVPAQAGEADVSASLPAAPAELAGSSSSSQRSYSSADADPAGDYTARRDAVVLRHDGSPWNLEAGDTVAGGDVANLSWALVNGDLEPVAAA